MNQAFEKMEGVINKTIKRLLMVSGDIAVVEEVKKELQISNNSPIIDHCQSGKGRYLRGEDCSYC